MRPITRAELDAARVEAGENILHMAVSMMNQIVEQCNGVVDAARAVLEEADRLDDGGRYHLISRGAIDGLSAALAVLPADAWLRRDHG